MAVGGGCVLVIKAELVVDKGRVVDEGEYGGWTCTGVGRGVDSMEEEGV